MAAEDTILYWHARGGGNCSGTFGFGQAFFKLNYRHGESREHPLPADLACYGRLERLFISSPQGQQRGTLGELTCFQPLIRMLSCPLPPLTVLG